MVRIHVTPTATAIPTPTPNSHPSPTPTITSISTLSFGGQESDVDIEVDEGTADDDYLSLLSERLPTLVDQVRPDLIFYQVGGVASMATGPGHRSEKIKVFELRGSKRGPAPVSLVANKRRDPLLCPPRAGNLD